MKIWNIGRALVAICGHYSLAKRVVQALRDELIYISDVRIAFARAVEETLTSDDLKAKVHLVLLAPNGEDVTALFFNTDGDLNIRELENNHIVRLGSLGSHMRQLTAEVISQVAGSSGKPSQQLASVLALLQSIGVNTNLFEQRVGGAFYGAYVTSTEVKLQGDILYIVRQPNEYWTLPVSTSIRDEAVIIKSGITNRTKVLANTMNVGFNFQQWLSKWSGFVEQGFESDAHDFVSFLSAGVRNCTIVEMLQNTSSYHLKMPITVQTLSNGRIHFEMEVTSEICAAIDEPEMDSDSGESRTRVMFFPYKPPVHAPNAS